MNTLQPHNASPLARVLQAPLWSALSLLTEIPASDLRLMVCAYATQVRVTRLSLGRRLGEAYSRAVSHGVAIDAPAI